jgi:hypothetical protein
MLARMVEAAIPLQTTDPAMLATLAGLILFLWAFLAAICALYTPTAFALLAIDPLALHVVTGALTAEDLRQYERFNLVFSQAEIEHYTDVAQAIAAARIGLIGCFTALVALILLRPKVRDAATTRALVVSGAALVATGLGYVLAGYDATSDFLHGFVFSAGSHIFSADSLTAQIYGDGDMIAGAVFVMALTAGALVAAWASARLVFPWPAKPMQKTTHSETKRARGR